jgi:quinol monooxygenase YgiN
MIRSSVILTAMPGNRDDVVRALRSFIGPTRAQPGCLQCALYEDAEDPLHLCLIEEWDDEEHLQRRLRSKDYRNLLLVLELSTDVPQISFDEVSERRGIEVIHAARGGERQ